MRWKGLVVLLTPNVFGIERESGGLKILTGFQIKNFGQDRREVYEGML
jgi:hypothetical protein